jgi:hypothetical protein
MDSRPRLSRERKQRLRILEMEDDSSDDFVEVRTKALKKAACRFLRLRVEGLLCDKQRGPARTRSLYLS